MDGLMAHRRKSWLAFSKLLHPTVCLMVPLMVDRTTCRTVPTTEYWKELRRVNQKDQQVPSLREHLIDFRLVRSMEHQMVRRMGNSIKRVLLMGCLYELCAMSYPIFADSVL